MPQSGAAGGILALATMMCLSGPSRGRWIASLHRGPGSASQIQGSSVHMPKHDMGPEGAPLPKRRPLAPTGARERARWSAGRREEFYAGHWNFGYQVRDLHRMFRAGVQARMQSLGIPVSLWSYLWALYEEDGLIQNELARRVRLMGPSVVSAVNQMERLGLAQRRRNVEDRRTVNIHLTPKGWALRGQIVGMAVEGNALALQHCRCSRRSGSVWARRIRERRRRRSPRRLCRPPLASHAPPEAALPAFHHGGCLFGQATMLAEGRGGTAGAIFRSARED
jgi:DNA-binding MarR family transcriptional regulator